MHSLHFFRLVVYVLNVVLNGEVMLYRTSNGKLFSINEEEQREALKTFYERLVSIIFLAVQNSSIGDLVTHSLSQSVTDPLTFTLPYKEQS